MQVLTMHMGINKIMNRGIYGGKCTTELYLVLYSTVLLLSAS
jgi:hypothetical protein